MASAVGKLEQNNKTGVITPEVSLVNYSTYIVGTLVSVWHGSRSKNSISSSVVEALYSQDIFDEQWYLSAQNDPDFVDDIYYLTAKELLERYSEYAGDSGTDFKRVIKMLCKSILNYDIPVLESINFTFQVENANVAWREQLARGKHHQFWTQSSRIMDLRTMDVAMNKSVELKGGPKAVEIYNDAVEAIREAYKQLIDLGVPAEDIRLQPQSHTERLYWFISLRTLLTILNRRSDWIAQASLWTPIIAGVISIFRELGIYDIVEDKIGKPMCTLSYDSDFGMYMVTDYANIPDCEDRMRGIDTLPIDPLYLAYSGKRMPDHTDIEYYDYMKSMFIQIWNDDILEILGWDRNNPTKIGKYDRP